MRLEWRYYNKKKFVKATFLYYYRIRNGYNSEKIIKSNQLSVMKNILSIQGKYHYNDKLKPLIMKNLVKEALK